MRQFASFNFGSMRHLRVSHSELYPEDFKAKLGTGHYTSEEAQEHANSSRLALYA
jgi:hypothetical protein